MLAAAPDLFAFFYLILSGFGVAQIATRYNFPPKQCARSFSTAARQVGARSFTPGRSRASARVAQRAVACRRSTEQPVQRRNKKEFINSQFAGAGERLRFLNGKLSEQSMQTLSRRIDRLIAEFVEFVRSTRQGEGQRQTDRLRSRLSAVEVIDHGSNRKGKS